MSSRSGWRLLALTLLITTLLYWPGLHGGWLFDDYPNIVDNKGVQPDDATVSSLINAALSSPSSEFKRPLASLTFAVNFLLNRLDPFWMKLTNLIIHLLNGVLVFLFVRALLQCVAPWTMANPADSAQNIRATLLALLIATAWLLLPINLTAVLYVVQRMESLANLFVLAGLIGYIHGRRVILGEANGRLFSPGFLLCLASITLPAGLGVMAKETAVMLPLYALLLEWCLFDFRNHASNTPLGTSPATDHRLIAMFVVILVLPLLAGLGYLLPELLKPKVWSTRDFTMATRLLSEARVIIDYILWTLVPTPHELSFYHDDFDVSTGLLAPWTTMAGIVCLAALTTAVIWLRPRHPIAALGIALFIGSHLLTGTILPLELIYEHRNYFASLGLLLAVVPVITPLPLTQATGQHAKSTVLRPHEWLTHGLALLPITLLMAWWTWQTAATAYAWGEPLRLAKELANRAPESPRAQYELGRTYIIYSNYDPGSPYTRLAYEPLEKAASLPKSSILPQQALIFMNSRMHMPIEETWWNSMIAKLGSRKPSIQDESSLIALMNCMRENQCDLPRPLMKRAFEAAIAHPDPSARILAAYGEFAWNQLADIQLGKQEMSAAIKEAPTETAYRITLFHMLVSERRFDEAHRQLNELERLNIGGYLDDRLKVLKGQLMSSGESK
ncbi:hypothetical protein [Dyella sp. RRB7]|uniref:hypothetical protein n=1 Tax=Dyella sp. RRB7 TaxID=2919502 RepID=UPI001FAAE007|nr:hypothetical protein [Dyella sp. RRB7]